MFLQNQRCDTSLAQFFNELKGGLWSVLSALKCRATAVILTVVTVALIDAGEGRAEDLTGVVRGLGSGVQAQVYLEGNSDSGGDGPAICPGATAKRLRKLGGMTLKVSGEYRVKKDGSPRCLEAQSFTVLKVSGGRDAVVGTLNQTDGAFRVADDAGKAYNLAHVTGGLRKLTGKKVILDLKPINSPGGKEPSYKVVSYAEFPQ